ncbi:uncharacterized protein LOC124157180 [Ischnura elegans]|uniref:uncharacterized protein LOC124157180 n=1 Tax=Ischnura elegans TaxID=197161 RepID=UPI001ED87745|nr:uncharacterized protein LOC124157180 [Ischnura elegans]
MLYTKEISIGIDGVKCVEEVGELIKLVDRLTICSGLTPRGSEHAVCLGYLPENGDFTGKGRTVSRWCSECEAARKRQRDRERKRKVTSKPKHVLKINKRKNKRLIMQIHDVKSKMLDLQRKCADASPQGVEESIKMLPSIQQDAVRTCFAASRVKGTKGRRYPLNFIYDV